MLKKQEILSIIIAIIGVIALAIGVFIGWFKLSDILNYLPQLIIPSIVGILIWGFRQRIWNKLFPKSNDSEEFPIFKQSKEMKLGHPYGVENKIYHYNSREELPKFNDLINYATESVDICAITSTLMILQHSDVIKNSIKRGIKFTFLLFDKYSQHLVTYKKMLENSEDLEDEITKSMRRLCNMKQEYGSGNIIIKTYNSFEKLSIIIVDKNNDRAFIKIEEYNVGNPTSRRNEIVFKKDNPNYYQSYLDKYISLLEKSNNYTC